MQGGGQGETNAASQTDGNQFRDDELIILEDLGDGKMVKYIFSKIGRRLRLAHEGDEQLSHPNGFEPLQGCRASG
jgi:hypothetical protein